MQSAHGLVRAGKAKYDPKRHALVWKIKRFGGESEQTLNAGVELIATTREKKPWGRPPMSMTFQVSRWRGTLPLAQPLPHTRFPTHAPISHTHTCAQACTCSCTCAASHTKPVPAPSLEPSFLV